MKSILILEDEQSIRDSLAAYVEDCEFNAIPAEDSETAFELLQSKKIDAAIVDVRLPGMNGVEFVKIASSKFEDTVFVFHTGSPEFYFPDEFHGNKRISPVIFNKPVVDLNQLVSEVVRMMNT